jgi:hypothetical protein
VAGRSWRHPPREAIARRYDERKDLEEAEAKGRVLLGKSYLAQRILFYTAGGVVVGDSCARRRDAHADFCLGSTGMNDVLNARSIVQAGWRDRIPSSAWGLRIVIVLA